MTAPTAAPAWPGAAVPAQTDRDRAARPDTTTERLLRASGLPARWRDREHFVVLESGFGSGHGFLAVWNAWRSDPQRCERLHVLSFEDQPLSREDLQNAHAASPWPEPVQALLDAWPPLTPNLHCLDFEQGHVQLHLWVGDLAVGLRNCVAAVDAFLLDRDGPAAGPQAWDLRRLKSIARLAAADATLASATLSHTLLDALVSTGFERRTESDTPAAGGMSVARYAPRFEPKQPPVRGQRRAVRERRALVVGGGLAGCAAAWALAEQGWHSVVLERHARPAEGASGNPGGLFHGIVNAQDGAHARFNRAAAWPARCAVQHAITQHGVAGSTAGLLRLHTAPAEVGEMRALLLQLRLPADYVQALDASQASAVCGLAVQRPAWFYPGGGWVDPRGLARSYLERAGASVQWVGCVAVQQLRQAASGWELLDAEGRLIDAAETVVLTNAGDAMRLLGAPDWPIKAVRGQISIAIGEPNRPLPALPRVALSGAGYLLPEVNGQAVFGSTAQPGDPDSAVRAGDHADNLARLAQLCAVGAGWRPAELAGRTAWRCSADDRLPVIGGVPEPALLVRAARRLDQPRFVPRQSGLFVFTALGSRGITWSALGARVLAAAVSGTPSPLEADLLDAIDPARFQSRAVRRQSAL